MANGKLKLVLEDDASIRELFKGYSDNICYLLSGESNAMILPETSLVKYTTQHI